MADFKKFKVNNTTYNVKDETARNTASSALSNAGSAQNTADQALLLANSANNTKLPKYGPIDGAVNAYTTGGNNFEFRSDADMKLYAAGDMKLYGNTGQLNDKKILVSGEVTFNDLEQDFQDALNEFAGKAANSYDTLFDQYTYNVFNKDDPDVLIGEYLDANGDPVTNAALAETGFIPCNNSSTYTCSANGALLHTTRIICYYDVSKNFVMSKSNQLIDDFTPPDETCVFFRTLLYTTEIPTFMITVNDTSLKPYEPYVYEGFMTTVDKRFNKLEQGPWYGLTGVAFGTSLTYRSETTGGYLNFLPDLSGITFDNQGVGSSYICGNSGPRNMLEIIQGYTGYSGKDVIIVEGFVNDWYNESVLGTFTDSGTTTACGCLRTALNYIRTQNANAAVFLVLDHYGQNSGVDCSSTAVMGTYTQMAYYDELAKVAKSLGVRVIKLYEESEIGEYTPQYMIDNIHPNAKGAEQTANVMWTYMKQFMPNVR